MVDLKDAEAVTAEKGITENLDQLVFCAFVIGYFEGYTEVSDEPEKALEKAVELAAEHIKELKE